MCQDDTKDRSEHDDNRPEIIEEYRDEAGYEKKRYFHFGFGRKCRNRIDKNGERQRPEQNEH